MVSGRQTDQQTDKYGTDRRQAQTATFQTFIVAIELSVKVTIIIDVFLSSNTLVMVSCLGINVSTLLICYVLGFYWIFAIFEIFLGNCLPCCLDSKWSTFGVLVCDVM